MIRQRGKLRQGPRPRQLGHAGAIPKFLGIVFVFVFGQGARPPERQARAQPKIGAALEDRGSLDTRFDTQKLAAVVFPRKIGGRAPEGSMRGSPSR